MNSNTKRSVLSLSVLAVVLILRSSVFAEASLPWLGNNLLKNPGFEAKPEKDKPIPGWTSQPHGNTVIAAVDNSIRLAGKASLHISVPKSPSSIVFKSEPIPVSAGKRFLYSIAYRQTGFNTSGKPDAYEGVSSHSQLEWLDAKKAVIGRDSSTSRFPYGPSDWDIRDSLIEVPAGASFGVVSVIVSNGSLKHGGKLIPADLWIDGVQFREYTPPPTPDWAKKETERVVEGAPQQSPVRAFFVASANEFSAKGGQFSKIVIDKEAERGSALQSPAECGKGIMCHSPYFPAMPAGLYRLRAQIKLSDTAGKERAGFIDIAGRYAGQRMLMNFRPKAFKTAGQYQTIEQDFILRDSHWWCIRAYTDGNQEWSIDSVKVFPLHELQDRELLTIYPGVEGQIPADLKPKMARPYKVLFVAGLGYDAYRPTQILRLLSTDTEITPVWVRRDRSFHYEGFPQTAVELFDFDCIYLTNVNARGLALREKNLVREYVRRGGALVVIGGHQSFERGGWKGSLLEEVLPFEIAPSIKEGFAHHPKGLPLLVGQDLPWQREAELDDSPKVFFIHRGKLKPNTMVLASAGELPFLVAGEFGKGRVVCVLGVAIGSGDKKQIPFWRWRDWNYLMRNATWWAMRYYGLNLR
ncbi:MAG: glutamine amidotransferase [Planctomycetota bacterium]|nr:glutamine amidotransferase [Planctomycetota bacterium]